MLVEAGVDQTEVWSTSHLLFYRSLFALGFLFLYTFYKLREVMVTPINRQSYKSLIFRIGQQDISYYIKFNSLVYFSICTFNVISNLSPGITMLMAVFMLGEKIKARDIIMLTLATISATFIIVGYDAASTDDDSATGAVDPNYFELKHIALGLLLLNPLLTAGGMIATRKMKKFPETTVNTYMNLSMSIVFGTSIAVNPNLHFNVIKYFDGVCWFYILSMGLFVVFS